MSRALRRWKRMLHPSRETNAVLGTLFDALMMIVFGAWIFVPLYYALFVPPDPHVYACAGPGPADFGCTGGTDAIIANVMRAIVVVLVFMVFLTALIRLINRVRYVRKGKDGI